MRAAANPGCVHVVGAGLAGLAAATALADTGRSVILYEAAPHAGGRCRSYFEPALGQIGAALSEGAVKAVGTSPGRLSGWGLSVHPARVTASTLALTPRKKAPRNKDFIELSLPKMGRRVPQIMILALKAPRYRLAAPCPQIWRSGAGRQEVQL